MKHNRKAKKIAIKIQVCVLALAVAACSSVLHTPFSYAGNSTQINQLKDDLTDVNKEIDAQKKKLKDDKAKIVNLTAEINQLTKNITAAEADINELTAEINETKAEIEKVYEELQAKEAEVKIQDDSLNLRLRTMYKNGDIGMLAVLLGSQNMSDFLTNMEMIKRVYNADAELLEDLQGQYSEIDAVKNELVALKNKLMIQQDDLETKKANLEANKTYVADKKKSVEADSKELEKQIDELNAEANALTSKILALQSKDAYIGGSMCWPSASSTRISSPFGNRLHPILKVYKMHTGIDIAAASGTGILAANAGVVITAGWNNSYGYMVMIDHGGGIVTLYAHSSKLLVQKGDVVARGEKIALVGSTGQSTGPHLHFEVRVDGVYKNPLNYVSP